jgi:hypothetical protein
MAHVHRKTPGNFCRCSPFAGPVCRLQVFEFRVLHGRARGGSPCSKWKRGSPGFRPASARDHRPLALGLVRPILLVSRRAGTRRMPGTSPRPDEPAAPRARLASLRMRGRARGGQDPRRNCWTQTWSTRSAAASAPLSLTACGQGPTSARFMLRGSSDKPARAARAEGLY